MFVIIFTASWKHNQLTGVNSTARQATNTDTGADHILGHQALTKGITCCSYTEPVGQHTTLLQHQSSSEAPG